MMVVLAMHITVAPASVHSPSVSSHGGRRLVRRRHGGRQLSRCPIRLATGVNVELFVDSVPKDLYLDPGSGNACIVPKRLTPPPGRSDNLGRVHTCGINGPPPSLPTDAAAVRRNLRVRSPARALDEKRATSAKSRPFRKILDSTSSPHRTLSDKPSIPTQKLDSRRRRRAEFVTYEEDVPKRQHCLKTRRILREPQEFNKTTFAPANHSRSA